MSNNPTVEEFILFMRENYQKLKTSADKVLNQVDEEQLNWQPDQDSNSIAILMRHLAGNMKSRWTDFLNTDGEKEFRKRDDEFDERIILDKNSLFNYWNEGWEITLNTINSLKSDDMLKIITIRGEDHTVVNALYRQLTHYATHVGQIMYIGKMLKKEDWKSLSIPKKKH